MKVKASEVFRIDWTRLDKVTKLADKLGPGQTVYKYPGRRNYNITHTSRELDLLDTARIVYRTGGRTNGKEEG